MTYPQALPSLDESDDDPTSEDLRTQMQDRIAELLAELSECVDAPDGVKASSQFAVGDVDFTSQAWRYRLADVQDWLNFSDDLVTVTSSAFATSLATALGFENQLDGIETVDGAARLTDAGLERLNERVELAVRLQQAYLSALEAEGGSRASASAIWADSWSEEEDSAEDATPEPVTARADVWPISQLAGKKLNLTPSYQRGDVWPTRDRQSLIESILRGIPLPSIILLKTGASTPHDVVDGKQRLTAILRFVGKHPVALATVAEAHALHPDADFKELFRSDYPKFRRTWKAVMGEPLTAKAEDEHYFPFKLRNDVKGGGLVGTELEPLRGRYFTQIKDRVIHVADEEVSIEDLFGAVPAYKVPVIEYSRATQRQIHEVFKLYNKQGMHLNAEEIRNAVFHEVELTRAILVAAGDASPRSDLAAVAPSLQGVTGITELGSILADYGFGEARYRRTKVLGWVIATLINDTKGKLLPTTARHTDFLLNQIQEDAVHPLRSRARLAKLFDLVSRAAHLHAANDYVWPDKFRGDGSGKWQDLQVVGSLVGIAIATAGAPDDIEERIIDSAESISVAAANDWVRPDKTQTRSQWDYIARIARGVVDILEVDMPAASNVIRQHFGSSGVESLLGSILQPGTR